MNYFYYGCELLYTVSVVWLSFRLMIMASGNAAERGKTLLLCITGSILLAVIYVYNSYISEILFSNGMLLVLAILGALWGKLLCDGRYLDNLLCSCLVWILAALGDFFCQSMIYLFAPEEKALPLSLVKISTERSIYLLFWSLLLIVTDVFLSRKRSGNIFRINYFRRILWIYVGVLATCEVYFQRIYLRHVTDRYLQSWQIFLLAVFLAAAGFCFFLISYKEKEEHKLLQMKAEMLEKSYRDLSQSLEQRNILLHDMKNHLLMIGELLEQKHYDEAGLYVRQISGTLQGKQRRAATGHPLIDLILDSKATLAAEKRIILHTETDNLKELQLKEIEICALFANLLDNAIEANERLPEGKRRWIDLSCRRQGQMLVIHIENASGGIVAGGNKLPQTSKSDRKLHGLGMQSIWRVAEVYGGYMNFEGKSDIFSVTVYLQGFEKEKNN